MKNKILKFGAIFLALSAFSLTTNASAAPMGGISDLSDTIKSPSSVQKVQYYDDGYYGYRRSYQDYDDYYRYPHRRIYRGSYGYTYGGGHYGERYGRRYHYDYRCRCRCNTYYREHDCD